MTHRVFSRCAACSRDIAAWEGAENAWWHLDGWLPHDHAAIPTRQSQSPPAEEENPPVAPAPGVNEHPSEKEL